MPSWTEAKSVPHKVRRVSKNEERVARIHKHQDESALQTVEIAWPLYFPGFDLPDSSWIRTWLRFNTLNTVLSCFEHVQELGETYRAPENLHKKLTHLLKTVTFAPDETL